MVVLVAALALMVPTSLAWIGTWVINPMLGVIMFGMGLTLSPQDFKIVLSRPKDILIGCLTQFTVMPLLALGLTWAFALPEELAIGVILVGCCPGGTASNVITYLAKGDLALSVGMTAASTLLAPLLTPLLVWALAGTMVDVDALGMLMSIVYVVIAPIVGGLLCQRFIPRVTRRVTPYLPAFSSVMIALLVGIIVAHNADRVLTAGLLVMLIVIFWDWPSASPWDDCCTCRNQSAWHSALRWACKIADWPRRWPYCTLPPIHWPPSPAPYSAYGITSAVPSLPNCIHPIKHQNNKMNKKAIIVGASSGIGQEVARLLLADGWHIGVAARREEPLMALKATAPEHVEVMTIDVTKEDAGEQLLMLIERLGGMDLYFHASGIGKQNRTLTEDIELRTMATNAVGFTRMIGTAYRYFAERGNGHIAAISSIAGTKGLGPAPAYSATKALQATYLQALEQQACQRKLDIRITDIRPGFVDTALLNDDFPYPLMMKPETVAKDIVQSIYRKRHVRIIDWRYRVLTKGWQLIPRWLWRRFKI